MAWKRSSVSLSDNPRPFARKGGIVWSVIKVGELIIAVTCLLLLLVTHILYPVRDNFTFPDCDPDEDDENDIYDRKHYGGRNRTNRTYHGRNSQILVRPLEYFNIVSAMVNGYDDTLGNGCWYYDDHHKILETANYHGSIPLGFLLVLYVICVTIIIAVIVELISLLLKDPVNKCPSMLLSLLYIGLGCVLFFVSLFAAIKSALVILIIFCLLSGVLLVLAVIDFVLLLYS